MFEELKEMICEYVDIEPGEIREDSRFVEGHWALIPMIL